MDVEAIAREAAEQVCKVFDASTVNAAEPARIISAAIRTATASVEAERDAWKDTAAIRWGQILFLRESNNAARAALASIRDKAKDRRDCEDAHGLFDLLEAIEKAAAAALAPSGEGKE